MERDVFFRFYANLPVNIRKEIVLNLKEAGGPITWEIAYREIQSNTDLGQKILNKLVELKFIPLNHDENEPEK